MSTAINDFEVQTGIIAVLLANAAVQTALGNPARIYTRILPGSTFPYARMDTVPDVPYTGGKGGNWVQSVHVQFTIFDNDTTLLRVAAAKKAISDAMNLLPNTFNVSNYKLSNVYPGVAFCGYDADNEVATAICAFRCAVERTA